MMGDARTVANALGGDTRFSGTRIVWSDFPKSEAKAQRLVVGAAGFGGMVEVLPSLVPGVFRRP